MSEFPIDGAVEQDPLALPDDADDAELPSHGDDVDPAEAFAEDRIVPVDEDERL
ncbi:MAG: hypothetical protein WCB04_00690 [Mycobacteriales bacterium]